MGSSETTQTSGGTAISRDQELAQLLQWAGDEMGVKAPKLKGGFVDGLRGGYVPFGTRRGGKYSTGKMQSAWQHVPIQKSNRSVHGVVDE